MVLKNHDSKVLRTGKVRSESEALVSLKRPDVKWLQGDTVNCRCQLELKSYCVYVMRLDPGNIIHSFERIAINLK